MNTKTRREVTIPAISANDREKQVTLVSLIEKAART